MQPILTLTPLSAPQMLCWCWRKFASLDKDQILKFTSKPEVTIFNLKCFFPRSHCSRILPLFGASFTAGTDAQVPKLCALLAVSQMGPHWVRAQQLCFPAWIVALLFLCTLVAFPVFLCWGGRHRFQPFSVSAWSLEVGSCFILFWLETWQTFPEAVWLPLFCVLSGRTLRGLSVIWAGCSRTVAISALSCSTRSC